MKNGLTELVFLIDKSGSMFDLVADTIGGFNSAVREEAEKQSKTLVTTIFFNDKSYVIHDRLPVSEIPLVTEDDYRPSGCTALIDALGTSIRHIKSIHKYAREEDVPEHTVFIITTDGLENASHVYSAEEVREMVKYQTEKQDWEFIFLAANIDAVETAKSYGIEESRAVNYHNDSIGTRLKFKAVGNAVDACRMNMPLDASHWKDELENDYLTRL
jgi:hypothetical protein